MTMTDPKPQRISELTHTALDGLHRWGMPPLFFAVLRPEHDRFQFFVTALENYPRRTLADIATDLLTDAPGLPVFAFGIAFDDRGSADLGTLGVVLIADRHANLWRAVNIKGLPGFEPVLGYHPAGTAAPGGTLTDEIRSAGAVLARIPPVRR
jgi:hypothetical protein